MREKANRLIATWRSETVARLCKGLHAMMDNISDVLVDFASKAENMNIQTEFFDVQRDLYLKGTPLAQQFCERLRNQQATEAAQEAQPDPHAPLSMMDKDDYELAITLDTVAEKSCTRNRQELFALQERLSALQGGRRVEYPKLPLNAHQVVHVFGDLLDALDFPKRPYLVLVTLFDKYVVKHFDEALPLINRQLAEAGVLPNIRYAVPQHPRNKQLKSGAESSAKAAVPPQNNESLSASQGANTGQASPAARPPRSANETIRAIAELLAAKRRHQRAAERRSKAAAEAATYDDPMGGNGIAPAERVMQFSYALDSENPQLQANSAAIAVLQSDKLAVDKQLLLRVRQALQAQRRMIESLSERAKLAPREQDVIEIVGMLFEAMLDDETIPLPAKTLLSHLHTPFLKIAINDSTFLDGKDHPARSLLDQMLQLSVRWVDPEHLPQGIFPTMQYCVRTILGNPLKSDFAHLKEELQKREAQLQQQGTVTEKRTLENERGQATLNRAREMAQSAVHELIVENPLPTPVSRFLQTVFTDYLSLLLLRNGLEPQHPACRSALSDAITTIEHLVAHDNPAAIDSAIHLGTQIRELLPHYQHEVSGFVERLHQPMPEEPIASHTEEPEQHKARQPPSAAEQIALDLEAGSWFNWHPSHRQTSQPVKLLWINPHTRNMLFVDQNGGKAVQMAAHEVAGALQDGSLKALVSQPRGGLFVSLLETIRNRLQPNNRAQS